MFRLRTWTIFGATLLLVGCEGVPDIRFVGDSGSNPEDSATDGGPKNDATTDAQGDGSGPQCTGTQPTGGFCCGNVWCVNAGTECSARCGECQDNRCDLQGKLCCAKQGPVQCKPTCP